MDYPNNIIDASINGNIEYLLEVYSNIGDTIYCTPDLMLQITETGNLECLKFWYSVINDKKYFNNICLSAAEYGHIHILDWYAENISELDPKTYIKALRGGNLHIANKLTPVRLLDMDIIEITTSAISRNDRVMLDWLFNNKYLNMLMGTELIEIIFRGQWNLLIYPHEWDQSSFDYLNINGENIELVEALSNEWKPTMMAIDNMNLHMLHFWENKIGLNESNYAFDRAAEINDDYLMNFWWNYRLGNIKYSTVAIKYLTYHNNIDWLNRLWMQFGDQLKVSPKIREALSEVTEEWWDKHLELPKYSSIIELRQETYFEDDKTISLSQLILEHNYFLLDKAVYQFDADWDIDPHIVTQRLVYFLRKRKSEGWIKQLIKESDGICNICFDTGNVIVLNCSHTYHLVCIIEALKTLDCCSYCNMKIVVK